nr:hypothetical protein [Tanacetum cinerariifolium]
MESSIVQQVSTEFNSSLPALVIDSLKEQLPSLLSDALKVTLPQLLKDSIKSSISKSIEDELPHVEAQEKKEGTFSMEDDSDDDDLDYQPLSKRFKITTPIPNQIPLNTFVPKHLLKPEEQQKSLHDFTN